MNRRINAAMRHAIVALCMLVASGLAVGVPQHATIGAPSGSVTSVDPIHHQPMSTAISKLSSTKGHGVGQRPPRRQLSRRNPTHPTALAARDDSSPMAVANKVISLCATLGTDSSHIHHLVARLQLAKSRSRAAFGTMRSSKAYHNQVSAQLAEWQKHANTIPPLEDIHRSLAYFGREKGMANLNKKSDIEVALKNMVNFIKYTLSDINFIVYEIPALGPILGPVVYEVKCIVDDTLNGAENTVDGILNDAGLATLIKLDTCAILTAFPGLC